MQMPTETNSSDKKHSVVFGFVRAVSPASSYACNRLPAVPKGVY